MTAFCFSRATVHKLHAFAIFLAIVHSYMGDPSAFLRRSCHWGRRRPSPGQAAGSWGRKWAGGATQLPLPHACVQARLSR